jgi:hypothetical protein
MSIACTDRVAMPTSPARSAALGPVASLNLYGAGGIRRASPQSPCAAGAYRQFDFWLGDWNVFDPAGTQIGTNAVKKQLDGCVIAEYWTSSGGQRGRSINTYDAETGHWHQTWVTQNTLGHLRLTGGLENGIMVMRGQRFIPPNIVLFNEFTWTPLADGRVLQVGVLDIPAIGLHSEFRGYYEHTDDLHPAPESPGTQCLAGGVSARTRELDFLVGRWVVSVEDGPTLGLSEVTTDLSGCLIEERFTSDKGYAAVSFAYFDRTAQDFFRTYIDSEGERLELSGDFSGASLVLTGADRDPGAEVILRVSFEPIDGNHLRQDYEISRDGGATWTAGVALLYRRS